jgi:23S rRNA (cytidine2498-2'-O)-methyltransferase
LRQKGLEVTAVDPAHLDFALQADGQVHHLAISAEEYLEMEPGRFDVIVNDMRMDARDSARLMASYADHLFADGWGIMTFKLPAENRESALDHALNILKRPYQIVGVRQLFHNRSEVTVVIKPKKG